MARRHKANAKAAACRNKQVKRIRQVKVHKLSNQANSAAKYIRNLSDATLNQAEISALGKGLKCVPIPRVKVSEIVNDFKKDRKVHAT